MQTQTAKQELLDVYRELADGRAQLIKELRAKLEAATAELAEYKASVIDTYFIEDAQQYGYQACCLAMGLGDPQALAKHYLDDEDAAYYLGSIPHGDPEMTSVTGETFEQMLRDSGVQRVVLERRF